MTLTEEQRKEIRNMVETHPGWKHLEKWIEERMAAGIAILIDRENEEVRGEIKALQSLKRKIESSLKHYEKETKED